MKPLHFFVSTLSVFLCAQFSATPNFSVPFSAYGTYSNIEPVPADKTFSAKTQQAVVAGKQNIPTSIVFTGDVMLARNVEYLTEKHGCPYPTNGIQFSKLFTNAHIIGNFEGAIPKQHVRTPNLQLQFSISKKCIPELASAGFTHFSLSNNHSSDFGADGLRNTKNVLQTNGIVPFGGDLLVDEIRFIPTGDGAQAIIPLHTLNKMPSRERLEEVFAYATARSAQQVVYVHWGEEYKPTHSKRQETIARLLVELGADLIVGHHPHVVQDIQLVDGVPVFYSLGNYIFDQYFSPEVQTGLILEIEPIAHKYISLIPVTSVHNLSQPVLMTKRSHSLFLKNLAAKSDKRLHSQIISGKVLFESNVATSPKVAIMTR